MDTRQQQDVGAGARAGVLGTLAMSALMLLGQRAGFRHAEQPPKRIVEHVLDVGRARRSTAVDNVLSTAAHLGYGAALGVVYRVLRRRVRLPGPPLVHGAGYGLGVWAANYAGWIPAAGIMPRPWRDVPSRQAATLAGHLLFGAVLGVTGDPPRARAAGRPRRQRGGQERRRGSGRRLRDRRARERPPAPPSTHAVPGGDTITAAQDIERGEGRVIDDHTVTRPVDVEEGGGGRAEPDDAARTEPAELEPPERQRPPRNA